MKTLTLRQKTAVRLAGIGGALLAVAPAAFATPVIANDTLEGLSDVGTELSQFLQNLVPGVFAFLLLLGLAAAIVGIIGAVISRIRGGIGGRK